jgi:hypothetical protein
MGSHLRLTPPNAHSRQVVHQGLTKAREGNIDRTVPSIETSRIAGLNSAVM